MHVNRTSNHIHSFIEIIKYTISEEIAILNTSHLQQVPHYVMFLEGLFDMAAVLHKEGGGGAGE